MNHPSASEVPSLEVLVEAHVQYMSRLAETEQEESQALVDSLNMPELLNIAGRALGRGFNQVFNLTFQDQNIKAVARINMPCGGGRSTAAPEDERRDRVASEAATLKWVKQHTSIPVPRIFGYDSDPSNVVGATFMIQEKISGRPLSDVWGNLCFEDRKLIIRQLGHIQSELYKTSFSKIGSIFEDSQAPPGHQFYVGRRAPPVQVERVFLDKGPWKTHTDQLRSFLTEQLNELSENQEYILSERQKNNGKDLAPADIDEFKSLYIAVLDVVDNSKLFAQWTPSFSLSHPDFSLHNILVAYEEPTRIVGLIDWEGARVQPWWQTSPTPGFMWDEIDNSTLPTDSEGQWDDILEEWDNILSVQGTEDFNSSDGIYLGKLACLVFGDYSKWATVQRVVEFVMTWRLEWPHAHDPALAKLDQILQRHRPDFTSLVRNKSTKRNGQGS